MKLQSKSNVLKFVVRSITILTMALGVSACATVGAPFHFKGSDSIVVGKTTRADIASQYGKPFRVGYDNGNRKWTYGYYHYRVFGASETKDLVITFDKNGVVRDYTYSSSLPEEVDAQLQ